jgi:transposase
LGYFTYIWDILRTFGIFYDHSVHFGKFISGFGIMYQEKSGNPG